MTYSDPMVTYSHPKMTFEWPSWVHPLPFPFPELHKNLKVTYFEDPKVTHSGPKVTYSDPKVTYSDPKVTHNDPTYLPLPSLT